MGTSDERGAKPTTVIATLTTRQAAVDVAGILRANEIECEINEPSDARYGGWAGFAPPDPRNYFVFIAKTDQARAHDALQGVLVSKWFLLTPDGLPYHAFEAATVDVLRSHVAGHPETDDWSLRDVAHLADEMERRGWNTVYQAFHDRHLLHERERPLDARTLDDWARRCGCGHIHQPPTD
jgi:hypothetical protein